MEESTAVIGAPMTRVAGVEHLLVIRPPRRQGTPEWWTPWRCLCGHGQTAGDDAGALFGWQLHVAGMAPAFIDYVPGSEAVELRDGSVIWVKS